MSYQTSSKRLPLFWLLIGARKLVFFWHQSDGRNPGDSLKFNDQYQRDQQYHRQLKHPYWSIAFNFHTSPLHLRNHGITQEKVTKIEVFLKGGALIYGTCWNICSLRKQSKFGDSTTVVPAKWRLRYEFKNSILMTSHYPDLGSACDNFLVQSNFPDLCSDMSSVWNFCVHFWDVLLQEISGSVTRCWLFSQAKIFVVNHTVIWLGQFLIVYSLMWCNRYSVISCDRNWVWSVFIKQRNSFWKVLMPLLSWKASYKTVHDNRIFHHGSLHEV